MMDVQKSIKAYIDMRLTQWTDYSLRVLMYCAVTSHRARAPTVSEIAESHGISRSHLMKIVMTLASLGYIETSRGRGGGIRLLKPADEIMIGEVLRQSETDFKMVECFDEELNTCKLDGACRLKSALRDATDAYLNTLDGVSLASVVAPPSLPRSAPLRRMQKPIT